MSVGLWRSKDDQNLPKCRLSREQSQVVGNGHDRDLTERHLVSFML
jgi:hypothetical protein